MTRAKPTIAITGASGFLGTKLVEHFSKLGWHVVGLVRRPSVSENPNVEHRRYDMEAPLDADLLRGVDYLVHTAFVPYDAKHKNAKEINITAAEQLAAASKSLKWRVFISSMSAHEEAISNYGLQKLAIEKIFAYKHDTILRPGLIIGGEGIVKRMANFMKSKHAVPLIGGGKQPLQTIAVDDLALMIEKVITKQLPGRFIAAAPAIYTYKQFYQQLAARIHTKVLFIPLPYWSLMLVFKTAGLLHIPLAVGEDNLKGLKKLTSADTKPGLKIIGITLKDLPASLKQTDI